MHHTFNLVYIILHLMDYLNTLDVNVRAGNLIGCYLRAEIQNRATTNPGSLLVVLRHQYEIFQVQSQRALNT